MIYFLIGIYLILVGILTYESILDVSSIKRFIIKIITSVGFVSLLIYCYFKYQKIEFFNFKILLTAMIISTFGDVLLGIYNRFNKTKKRYFLIGTGLFFVAQIFYIMYFGLFSGYRFTILYIFMPLIFGILAFIIIEKLKIGNKLVSIFGCSYAFAVSFMLVSSMWYSYNSGNMLAFFGGLLFLISDYTLSIKYFSKLSNNKIICFITTTTYYLAQLLFVLLICF